MFTTHETSVSPSVRTLPRRELLRLAICLPFGALLSNFKLLAEPFSRKVKITNIKAMALRNIAGNCLIRVETDSGLVGYGEAGSRNSLKFA